MCFKFKSLGIHGNEPRGFKNIDSIDVCSFQYQKQLQILLFMFPFMCSLLSLCLHTFFFLIEFYSYFIVTLFLLCLSTIFLCFQPYFSSFFFLFLPLSLFLSPFLPSFLLALVFFVSVTGCDVSHLRSKLQQRSGNAEIISFEHHHISRFVYRSPQVNEGLQKLIYMFVRQSVCTANIQIFDSCTHYWIFVQDEAITI